MRSLNLNEGENINNGGNENLLPEPNESAKSLNLFHQIIQIEFFIENNASNISKIYLSQTGLTQTQKIFSFELFGVRFDDKVFDYYFFAGENPPNEEVITTTTENISEESLHAEFFTEKPGSNFFNEEGKTAEDYPSATTVVQEENDSNETAPDPRFRTLTHQVKVYLMSFTSYAE